MIQRELDLIRSGAFPAHDQSGQRGGQDIAILHSGQDRSRDASFGLLLEIKTRRLENRHELPLQEENEETIPD